MFGENLNFNYKRIACLKGKIKYLLIAAQNLDNPTIVNLHTYPGCQSLFGFELPTHCLIGDPLKYRPVP